MAYYIAGDALEKLLRLWALRNMNKAYIWFEELNTFRFIMNLLANTLSAIKNAEMRNKKECIVYPASKFVGSVLKVIQKHAYIGEFERIDDGRGGKFRIQLLGRINDCGIIKPRLGVSYHELVKYESKYLPSRDIGLLILSTSKGIMTSRECMENRIGGVLLCYVY